MRSFKPSRKVIIYVISGVLGLLISCCLFLAIIPKSNGTAPVNTPIINTVVPTVQPTISVPTLVPTNIPTDVPTVVQGLNKAQYVTKLFDWSTRLQNDFQLLSDVQQGKIVSKSDLANVPLDIIHIQSEVHDTIPPVEYADVHAHFQAAIDLDVQAMSVAKDNPQQARQFFLQANEELTKSLELFQQIQ